MKSRRRRSIAFAAGCCVLLLLASGPVAATEEQDLEILRARIEHLRANIAGAEETRDEARDQLRESERAISQANRSLRTLSAARDAAQSRLSMLTAQSRATQSKIDAQQEALGRWLTLRYLAGEPNYLKLLLSGEDPNRAAREMHYYSYISRAQIEFIATLRSNLAGMRQLESEMREKAAELARIDTAQRKERGGLLRQQAERRRVLSRVSTQLREQRRQVKRFERDESRLTRLVEGLAKVIAATPSETRRRNEKVPEPGEAETRFERLRGSLRLPIRGELANRFGAPRSGGGLPWKGLFIRSASGQDVRAVAPGQVVFSEWLRGFGNLLIIDHGQDYLSIYGNNESVLKQVGERVRTGETVATVGASGGGAETGLYFEIRHKGRPFDPLRWASLK